MRKITRIALGAVTAWPLLYVLVFVATFARAVLPMFTGRAPVPSPQGGPPTWFALLFAAHVGTMLVMLALTVFYVQHAYRSPRVPESRRVVWVLLNVVGGFVGQLAYWYLFVWREPVLETRSPGQAIR